MYENKGNPAAERNDACDVRAAARRLAGRGAPRRLFRERSLPAPASDVCFLRDATRDVSVRKHTRVTSVRADTGDTCAYDYCMRRRSISGELFEHYFSSTSRLGISTLNTKLSRRCIEREQRANKVNKGRVIKTRVIKFVVYVIKSLMF